MKNLKLPFNKKSEYNPIFLDVETQYLSSEIEGGWKSIDKFLMSIAITWDKNNEFRVWHEEDCHIMIDELIKFNPIITYNGEGFDFIVLSHYGNVDGLYQRSKDLCSMVTASAGHRVHMDSIAKSTLNSSKIATGLDAVAWWRSGDPELRQKVIDYCKMDVVILRDIFNFVREKGYLTFDDLRGGTVKLHINLGV